MKDQTRDTILGLIVSIIVWGSLMIGVWMYLEKKDKPIRIVDRPTVERMKYHGVTEAYEDHKGNIYFIREGKRCRL